MGTEPSAPLFVAGFAKGSVTAMRKFTEYEILFPEGVLFAQLTGMQDQRVAYAMNA